MILLSATAKRSADGKEFACNENFARPRVAKIGPKCPTDVSDTLFQLHRWEISVLERWFVALLHGFEEKMDAAR
jgi:hypothetical protein